ncbi:Phosphofurin acidic cluster sorting protein 2 [Nymphon striatum]|nr:Phosphofurin acidic cluster sorting protein 2 [Nymphon striatum]
MPKLVLKSPGKGYPNKCGNPVLVYLQVGFTYCNELCSLTLTKLLLLQPVGDDISSLTVAVKMQSSKRTLRSNEIIIPNSGLLDTELDLTFSLQYPHFLKRDGNKLQIMLQRRKRYKNRTFLGFKTLAVGYVNMSQVLQKSMDKELELYSNVKEKNNVVAKVLMLSLSSQPVDHDEDGLYHQKSLRRSGAHAGDRTGEFSDEDEYFVSSNEEGSDSEPMLEESSVNNHRSRGHLSQFHSRQRSRKSSRSKVMPGRVGDRRDSVQQRNIKQKFIALLKRFKITDELQGLDSEQDHEEMDPEIEDRNPQDIDDLFAQFEDLSDSEPEMDTMSISSTPKPCLRPYFSSTTLTIADKQSLDRMSDDSSKKTGDSDSHHETCTDPELSDPQVTGATGNSPPKTSGTDEARKILSSAAAGQSFDKKSGSGKLFSRDKDKKVSSKEKDNLSCTKEKNSLSNVESSPRKIVVEQLNKIFSVADDQIPDHIAMINMNDSLCQILSTRLTDLKSLRVVCTASIADIRYTFSSLISKIQKFCSSNAKTPSVIKIGVIGSESYVNYLLRSYVDHFSSKPKDWQTYVKFLIIPIGMGALVKYLGSIDNMYNATFLDNSWRDLCDRVSEDRNMADVQDILNRISLYINNASSCVQVPIGEAMLQYKEKSPIDESSQAFIPFLSEVRVGSTELSQLTSVDIDDVQPNLTPSQLPSTMTSSVTIPGMLSGSPTSSATSNATDAKSTKDNTTPPSSPNIGSAISSPPFSQEKISESLDLVIDFWLPNKDPKDSKKSSDNKSSLKTTFRSLQASLLPNPGELASPKTSLSMSYIIKEKKQKMIRIGKKKEKERDFDTKPQVVEGIQRIICSSKAQLSQLKVIIDGVEWTSVKFFQLSSLWQTQVTQFPIGIFALPESNF